MRAEIGELWEWSGTMLYLILAVHEPRQNDWTTSLRYDALELNAGKFWKEMPYTIGTDEGWKRVV